jgi:predicted dehydrogenase
MNQPPFRWGILGAAQIARKNWKAIRNSGNGVVAAVASRDRAHSERFIQAAQSHVPFTPAPKALGSYEELIAAPDVDGLYIPLPTGIRKEWVLRAAAAGKHVVCEKPCSISVADLEEMIAACRHHSVQFMDGVMFAHSRRLDAIREVIGNREKFGRIKRIHSVFNFNGEDEFFRTNIRVQSGLEPHGCLGDLGWYCLRFALWVMDWALPLEVSGRVLSWTKHTASTAPTCTEFEGELFFVGGVSAPFYCSFVTQLQQTAEISGTHGYLQVSDFVLPFCGDEVEFETASPVQDVVGCDFNLEPRDRRWGVREYSHSHPNAQETNLFRNFASQAMSGRLNEDWPQQALKTQQVMQACLDSAAAGSRPVALGR